MGEQLDRPADAIEEEGVEGLVGIDHPGHEVGGVAQEGQIATVGAHRPGVAAGEAA